uniref:Uncharacterized protein LOC113797841 n=1 Tax=Dermatophagoides pteronyssinus TaxID=6956 RepID=A0A6P6YGZ0_DERPT|nr:uncharacterized protein LOC113797841 [Dermatophagoides pteronyssinus]
MIEYIHCLYLISLFAIPLKALIIVVEYLIVQFKQIVLTTKQLFDYRFNHRIPVIIKMRMNWNDFYGNYIRIFDHTAKFNHDLKIVLLAMETVSKASIIFSTIFYSQKITETIPGAIFVICLFSFFCLSTGVYSRFSNFPSFNHRCYQHLLSWTIRISKLQSKINANRRKKRLRDLLIFSRRDLIKINLFLQTMKRNRLGFTCGKIFFINKFQYVELVLMNIPLTIMFYKKICLNLNYKIDNN